MCVVAIVGSILISNRTCTWEICASTSMSDQTTLDRANSDSIDSYRVLCKGCKATLSLHLFLHPVDPSCCRIRMQCKRCIEKSLKNRRAHREHINAARAIRERDRERITCVCGTSINARYRAQHCKSKRHLSIVAVLREHNAVFPDVSASITPPAKLAADQESQISPKKNSTK